MTKNILRSFVVGVLAVSALSGCEEIPDREFLVGEDLNEVEFLLYNADQGVHPNATITLNPENPFRRGISLSSKFEANDLGPIIAFYGWAQALTQEPTGEHQFFTATSARDLYRFGLVEDRDLPYVRSIAVRGYQNCLTEFPDSTATFDVTGNARFDLLVRTIQELEDLGGEVPEGWALAEGPDGNLVATYSGD